jgi:hypothetical protein
MPESIADKIASRLTHRQLNLNQLSEGQKRVVWRMLGDVQTDIYKHLKRFDPTGPRTSRYRKARLEEVQKLVQETLRKGYKGIAKNQTKMLHEIADLEVDATKNLYNNAIGVDVLNVTPSPDEMLALVNDSLIEGAPIQEWWKRQAEGTAARFHDEMRRGLFLGESQNDLLRRVRGRRENGFRDGLQGITRKNAERLVRTSVNSVGIQSESGRI